MILEKRYHKRMDIHMDAHIMHSGRHIQAIARNITPYGIILSTGTLTVPKGMQLELSITIDGSTLLIPGLVVWSTQSCIGIIFTSTQHALYTAAESKASLESQAQTGSADTTRVIPKHQLFPPELHTS